MGVKLFDVRWVSHTAGPSPIVNEFGPNCRTELFFMGCEKAASGNPCKNCFNPALWQVKEGARELNPYMMAEHIEEHAPQRYITIVGGEPIDQYKDLITLCKELKKRNFHIIVFTHYRVTDIPLLTPCTKEELMTLLTNIDILVDGSYECDLHIYDESIEDGFHNSVGSGNQIIWDCRNWTPECLLEGYAAKDLMTFNLRLDDSIVFITKEDKEPYTIAFEEDRKITVKVPERYFDKYLPHSLLSSTR